jgi:hypothetical protein
MPADGSEVGAAAWKSFRFQLQLLLEVRWNIRSSGFVDPVRQIWRYVHLQLDLVFAEVVGIRDPGPYTGSDLGGEGGIHPGKGQELACPITGSSEPDMHSLAYDLDKLRPGPVHVSAFESADLQDVAFAEGHFYGNRLFIA